MPKCLLLLGAIALCSLFAGGGTANAGTPAKAYYICWTSVAGNTDCAALPRWYRIPGVRRPTCCNVRADSDRSEFYLTRRQIRALAAQGVRIDTMAPGAWAQVQAVCKRKHHF
jgi:hypothetical protein